MAKQKQSALTPTPQVIVTIILAFILLSFTFFLFQAQMSGKRLLAYEPQTRTYYIAAENVEWDYTPAGKDPMTNKPVTEPWGIQTKYQKVRYIEYTDDTFTKKKDQPQWLGILGPIIRGVEGDTIRVVFFNKAEKPYSMHPHGLSYDKNNEGALHDEENAPEETHGTAHIGNGAKIDPGQKFTYTWKVDKKAAPGDIEGGSKVWMYHSHVNAVEDIYEGLVGPIIITSATHANDDGTPNDVDKEFVTLFMVFDESEEDTPEEEVEGHLKHAINGYIFHNLQGLEMSQEDRVRWHLLGLGTEVDMHTVHWHGGRVKLQTQYTDVVELLPASMKTVDMLADNRGTWMYHCHVADHITAGMVTMYNVK